MRIINMAFRGLIVKDGLAATALMGSPQNVVVDAAGNVYVADLWSHKIRKIMP